MGYFILISLKAIILNYTTDLAPEQSGKKGRLAGHGRKLSIQDDFILSDEKIGDYFMAARRVLTNVFGKRK